MWYEGNWTAEFCVTSDVTTAEDGTATVTCDCSVAGDTAVFLVQSDEQLTRINDVRTFERGFTFT